jgi:hypothetical protein
MHDGLLSFLCHASMHVCRFRDREMVLRMKTQLRCNGTLEDEIITVKYPQNTVMHAGYHLRDNPWT